MDGICKERKTIDYDLDKLEILNCDKQILLNDIRKKHLQGVNVIYENQNNCATLIINNLKNKKIINILVYGMTQTGKTGCMTALIKHYMLNYNIPLEHIYIITGLSDVAWKTDTKNRLPDSINRRVYHRSNLPKTFVNDITSKKNLLIIMDEIQIGCTENQTIDKTFKKAGFYDLDNLLEKDIKLIQFTATPDGHLNDINNWGEYSASVKLEPGVKYVSAIQLLEDDRVKQFKDLSNIESVREIKPVIDTYDNPRYHTIRIPNSRKGLDEVTINNFKEVFGDECDYNEDYIKVKKKDINELLNIIPTKHTFIFIKEILRCAKTKIKTHIGIEYERYSKSISDSTVIQGSIGRLTGYDDNGDSICYTNIDTIKRYQQLWDSDFKLDNIKWISNTTINKNGIAESKGTYNSPSNIIGLETPVSHNENTERILNKEIFYGEEGQTKAKQFYKDNLKDELKGRGPQKRKMNTEGYYTANIRGEKKPYSIEELEKEKKWGFGTKNKYRFHPCYENISDTHTLQWWLLWY